MRREVDHDDCGAFAETGPASPASRLKPAPQMRQVVMKRLPKFPGEAHIR